MPGAVYTGVGGELPIGFTDTIGTGGTVWVGGPNVIYTGNAGWGDPTPTDVGFQAQPVTDPSYYGQVGGGAVNLNWTSPLTISAIWWSHRSRGCPWKR